MRRTFVALALALLAVPSVLAEVQKVGVDGTVHRVEVEAWPNVGKPQSTAIRHSIQWPSGGRTSALVPGTDDLPLDREPAIEIDAASGSLVLVWTRNDGTGFQVHSARFADGAWSAPVALLRTAGDQHEPQIVVAKDLIHVVWRDEHAGVTQFYRLSLWRTSLQIAFGPESLPAGGTADAAQPSLLGASGAPPFGASFFSVGLSGGLPGEASRVIVWGVRDEPVPIVYYQCFGLGPESRISSPPEALWIWGTFVMWFQDGDRLRYTLHRSGAWTAYRIVELSQTTGLSDAKLQVRDVLEQEFRSTH